MLTADHVRTRRRNHELSITPIRPSDEAILLDVASKLIIIFERSVGKKRDELNDELSDIIVQPRLLKVFEGFKKLLFDRSQFESPEGITPSELRTLVFSTASKMRAQLEEGERFERQNALIAAAAELDIDFLKLNDVLFADLKGEQRLTQFTKLNPQLLMEEYQLGQEQAVLLKASQLCVRVKCTSPSTYRYLFRQLKFRRLLFEIEPIYHKHGEHLVPSVFDDVGEPDEYEIKISGPHNLFKSSTKYGLQLALVLPILRICDSWRLSAQVHWGKERLPLDFYLDHQSSAQVSKANLTEDVNLPEELESMLTQLKKHKTLWRARRSSKILHLSGVGVCIPDLIFSHPDRKDRIYLEVMGYWSREAVWRRVELVQAGLPEHMIFAVSNRLRVSEKVLDDDLPSALLVYKGAILIHRLLELLNELVPDPSPNDPSSNDSKTTRSKTTRSKKDQLPPIKPAN